jgi:site-specific DNA recombinase
MKRVAIYARMSLEKQSSDSTSDQIARCRDFADQRGWQVVEELIFTDKAVSGGTRYNRPDLLELVDRVLEWDVLLCYDFTRLARNSEDLGWIRNKLRVSRRIAYAVDTGLDIFNVGAKVMGVLGEEYLEKLRHDTRRGLQGQFERGFWTGGTVYGYTSEPDYSSGKKNNRREPVPDGYRLKIDEDQAAVIRRIFVDYIAGQSGKAIAKALNREHVAPPKKRQHRGGSWAPTAIRAMLLNPLYMGKPVWGKTETYKDHETGIRKRYSRPEEEWIRRDDPSLAIVEPVVWERAQEVRTAKSRSTARDSSGRITSNHQGGRRKSKNLLAGWLQCDECGSAFNALYRKTWGCGHRYNRGITTCENDLLIPQAELESRVLGGLERQFLTPENVDYVAQQAVRIVQEERSDDRTRSDEQRLFELGSEIDNLIELAATQGTNDRVALAIGDREREVAEIKSRLARRKAPLGSEALASRVRRTLGDLGNMFRSSPEDARKALGALFGDNRLRVKPDPERGFSVFGDALLCFGGTGDRTRTCTSSRTVAPKATASTSFATPAINLAT